MITDNHPSIQQDKDPIRFALNAVYTDGIIRNDNTIKYIMSLKNSEYTILNSLYIDENKLVIFLVKNDESNSEIGLYDENKNTYETLVSEPKLNFKLNHQIYSITRRRRGCDDVIYWVDGYNRPRYYIIQEPDKFKTNGNWDIDKFSLISYDEFNAKADFKILDTGGILKSGSYHFFIRMLDLDLNPTEWLPLTTMSININVDTTTKPYPKIRGIKSGVKTNKSIKIKLSDINTDFPYYQIGVIEYTSGSGFATSAKVLEKQMTSNDVITFTGHDFLAEEDIKSFGLFANLIYSAKHINQIDNMLLLSGTRGFPDNLCKYQKYASKIGVDLYVKKVFLHKMTKDSPKSAMSLYGFMPEEVYSLGIVYKLKKDGFTTFAYHIPGKPLGTDDVIFSPGNNTYPMASGGEHENLVYEPNGTCDDFWGEDIFGNSLENTPVRFHKFPSREIIQNRFIEKINSTSSTFYHIEVRVNRNQDFPCYTSGTPCDTYTLKIELDVNGITEEMIISIPIESFKTDIEQLFYSDKYPYNNISVTSIKWYSDAAMTNEITPSEFTVNWRKELADEIQNTDYIVGYVYGIKLSNIQLPDEISGYYIVRHERTDADKTIIDTGVMTYLTTGKGFITHGVLGANLNYQDWEIRPGPNESIPKHNASANRNAYSKYFHGIITPSHLFTRDKINFGSIEFKGHYFAEKTAHDKWRKRDVMPGSTYDPERDDDDREDTDGWSIKGIIKDIHLGYTHDNFYDIDELENGLDIKNSYFFDILEYDTINIEDKTRSLFNASADNPAFIIETTKKIVKQPNGHYPYLYLKNKHKTYYSDFRYRPYLRITEFSNEPEIIAFNGDIKIQSLRYFNSVFYDYNPALRQPKGSLWDWVVSIGAMIVGAVLVVLGAVGSVFTGGLSLAAIEVGVSLFTWGASYTANNIDAEAAVSRYIDLYRKGAGQSLKDKYLYDNFEYYMYANGSDNGYSTMSNEDDEIQWYGEAFTNFWFETPIEISQREILVEQNFSILDYPGLEFKDGNHGFERSVYIERTGWNNDWRCSRDDIIHPKTDVGAYQMDKLVILDDRKSESGGTKEKYLGLPRLEYYKENKDYSNLQNIKVYYPVPYEYDCCTQCREKFDNRIQYSQQSFQEELTDNYKIFLPNNYRDIPAESGEIKNVYVYRNQIYIHTSDSLFKLPKKYQERIAGDIVTYIGTGSYLELPATKLSDEYGNSAGLDMKTGSLVTNAGIYFMYNSLPYLFNGQSIIPLWVGNKKLFEKYFKYYISEIWYKKYHTKYPNIDTTTHQLGVGYTMAHDIEYDRIFITKWDYLGDFGEIPQNALEVNCNNSIKYIDDFENRKLLLENAGWEYVKIENCKAKFRRKKAIHTTQTFFGPVKIQKDLSKFDVVLLVGPHVPHEICMDYNTIFENSVFRADKEYELKTTLGVNSVTIKPYSWYKDQMENNLGVSDRRFLKSIDLIDNNTYNKVIVINLSNSIRCPNYCPPHNNNCISTNLYDVKGCDNQSVIDDVNNFITKAGGFDDFLWIQMIPNYNGNMPPPESYHGNTDPTPLIVCDCGESSVRMLRLSVEIQAGNIEQRPNQFYENRFPGVIFNVDMSQYAQDLLNMSCNISPMNGIDGLLYRTLYSNYDIHNDSFSLAIKNLLDTQLVDYVERTVDVVDYEYDYTYLEATDIDFINKVKIPVTVSIKDNKLASFHSWHPYMFLRTKKNLYSVTQGTSVESDVVSINSGNKGKVVLAKNKLYKHNIKHEYGNYYGIKKPFIIDIVNKFKEISIADYIIYGSRAFKYNVNIDDYIKLKDVTFNKAIVYNDRQNSGLINLTIRDISNWMLDYISEGVSLVSLSEHKWNFSEFRDMITDISKPMFIQKMNMLEDDWFIDKKLNPDVFENKSWSDLEHFRDKYLEIRLIFDNFDNTKLEFFGIETIKTKSER